MRPACREQDNKGSPLNESRWSHKSSVNGKPTEDFSLAVTPSSVENSYMQNTPSFGFWVPRVACYPCFSLALLVPSLYWGADKPPDGGGRPSVAHKQTVEPANQNLGVISI
jgi:hypothetical protein